MQEVPSGKDLVSLYKEYSYLMDFNSFAAIAFYKLMFIAEPGEADHFTDKKHELEEYSNLA